MRKTQSGNVAHDPPHAFDTIDLKRSVSRDHQSVETNAAI
jgi:hypothetical protein